MRVGGFIAGFVLIGLAAQSFLAAQAGPVLEPNLSFEVASVRQTKDRAPMQWQPSGRFTSGVPILSLVSIGYGVPLYRIEGLPDWARTTLFAINATAGRQVEIDERPAYYRGLLVERFRLTAHVERRESDVFNLTIARSDGRLGPGLRPSDFNCDAILAESRRRRLAGEQPEPLAPGSRPKCTYLGGPASVTGDAAELAGLFALLGQALGRPVIDRTGLKGRFDIDFRAAPPGAREGSPAGALPPIATALEDQLGLKLLQDRAPVEVLVIDRLEMPTEN
jgi:uncharacterized protein (TIGR03435 family)